MIPENLILETDKVRLRPIAPADADAFHELAQADQAMWQYFSLNLADRQQLQRWMDMAFADKAAGTRRPFTIVEKSTGAIAGSTSMGNISLHDLRLEIGWSWLGAPFRSSGINRHSKYAMMRYAFAELGFERVEFKTDVLNERAKQGLRKVGGVEEGVLRSHMTMWNDRRRDSIFFSVIKKDWPQVEKDFFKGLA